MGVNGFLISCAMRRATSAQAAVRCADTRSVMSSNVAMKPAPAPASLATCTLKVRTVAPRLTTASPLARRHRLAQRAAHQTRQLRHRFGIVSAFQLVGIGIQKPGRRSIDDRQYAFVIKADHPGADAREHGFGE